MALRHDSWFLAETELEMIGSEETIRALPQALLDVGEEAASPWRYILRGLWESALRLVELMHVSWDKSGAIRPIWYEGQLPVLEIPAAMQKNDTEENIPLLPRFEAPLLEAPEDWRTRWVFKPDSLQLRMGRKVRHHWPHAEWLGRVISRIGNKAGIVVYEADERTGRPTSMPPLMICNDHVGSVCGTPESPFGHLPGEASFIVGDNTEALRSWRCSAGC